jgi:hypothetical protein
MKKTAKMPSNNKSNSTSDSKKSDTNTHTPKFEKRTTADGKPNPRYVDVLKVSKTRAGQNFAVLSFLSPEEILKQREQYLFEHFVREWDFTKCIEKSVGFVNFIAYKYGLDSEAVMTDFQDYVKQEDAMLKSSTIEEDWKNFLDRRGDALNKQFNIDHDFQTSVRAVKFYGAFSTVEEAQKYIKDEIDEDDIINAHAGPAGTWLYWDPDPYKTAHLDYREEELNRLYQEKIANEKKKDDEFKARVEQAKRKAIEDNVDKARRTGNTLTQYLDEQGNLVGVKESGKLDADTDARDK